MRITGGIAGGIRITTPPGEVRPAMDRMRESLFSILGPCGGISFLDLFSGSGVVGLEALSRGARRVTFVEKERRKRATMQNNLERVLAAVDYEPEVRIVTAPVERFVQRGKDAYDIIYLDPPFAYAHKNDLLAKLSRSALPEDGSLIILHYPKEETIIPGEFELVDEREYGRSHLLFLRDGAKNIE